MTRYRFILPLLFPLALLGQTAQPGAQELPLEPGLPRVLLIGDSIAGGYAPVVREHLKGKANVHLVQRRMPFNGDTEHGLEEIDTWLANANWDVIHFNWGLWDLKIRADGRNVVPIEQYGRNLRQLVMRLKQTHALLMFATTTPVPDRAMDPPRRTSDAVLYNAVARKIMEEEGIYIDDLYAVALPRLQDIQWPNDVHFAPQGDEILGERVSTCILYLMRSLKPKP